MALAPENVSADAPDFMKTPPSARGSASYTRPVRYAGIMSTSSGCTVGQCKHSRKFSTQIFQFPATSRVVVWTMRSAPRPNRS